MAAQEIKAAVSDKKAYEKIITAFKKKKKGSSAADIVAATGLPFNTVKDLVPKAADEFKGRLEVTQSGEILYSFPRGFTSRYHGFIPSFERAFDAFIRASATCGKFIFKIWIMVMLVGYFILFIAIALASLFLSLAGKSNSSSSKRGGGLNLTLSIFDLVFRLWFYSELTKSANPSAYPAKKSTDKKKPLHQSIYSFVFGDPDPNSSWKDEENKAFIAYLGENRGVISLPELMALNGLTSLEAEEKIIALCAQFGGFPEATPDGTVVYRFDEILLQSEKKQEKQNRLPLNFKNLLKFSSNPKKMNTWFSIINGVNLIFGSYFLYCVSNIGHNVTKLTSLIYTNVYNFLAYEFNPLPIITVALGIIPLAFSVLFWLIPGLRYFFTKKKNNEIRFENFRKFSFSKIWDSPLSIKKSDLNPVSPFSLKQSDSGPSYREARPKDLQGSQNKVLKELGVYSLPDISLDDAKEEVYSFVQLEQEKEALERYRESINPEASTLGETVFDSEE